MTMRNFGGLLPLLVVAVLLLASANLASTSSSAQASDPPAYVYLTWASDDTAHSINVSWRTDEDYVGEVRYDTESRGGEPDAYSDSAEGTGGVTTAKFDGYIHHVELTGLEPYTTYYFICGNPDYGWSEELSFRTAPVEKKDIRFVAGGDSRSDARADHPHPDWPEARDGVTQLMASYDPDFVIFTGDFLWNGETQEGGLDTWDNWLEAWYKYARAEDGRLIPMVPAIGNHELVYPQPSDYDPETHASNYYMLFNLPRNERWYSLNWGPDLHIVALDAEIRWTGSESWNDQLEWLRQDLLEHWDDLWKIAAAHRPAFTAGHYSGDANVQKDWIPEFDFYHVDLYFSGHDHNYTRTHPINYSLSTENYQPSPENGTIYMVSAGWGAPLYGGTPRWWTAYGPDGRYHFTLVDVYENDTLHLRPVSLGGQVFDELTIQKGVPTQPGGELPIAAIVISIVVIAFVITIYLLKMRRPAKKFGSKIGEGF